MRQRRPRQDGDALQEPLLPPEEAGSELWRLLAPLFALLACAASYLSSWWPAAEPPLDEAQERAVLRLRDRASVVFDLQLPQHSSLLGRLWAHSMPDEPLPALRGSHWSEALGFQGAAPENDLRAAGHLALSCLVYFAAVQPRTFQRLRLRATKRPPLAGYPFAVGGVNLCATLLDHLGIVALLPGSAAARFSPCRAFALCLTADDLAFEKLFCAALEHLDGKFEAERGTYMTFNTILARGVGDVREALVAVAAQSGDAVTVDDVVARLADAAAPE